MERVTFDSSGKISSIDGGRVEINSTLGGKGGWRKSANGASEEYNRWNNGDDEDEYDFQGLRERLRKSEDLDFLKEDSQKEKLKIEDISVREHWDLREEKKEIEPLVFSNGKSQENIVSDIVDLIKQGKKVIFLHGACGTGKSAIALNLARVMGKASIVVPVKALQRQYEEDYLHKKYLLKKNGQKMKIAMITGKDNHDSLYFAGKSCGDPMLPENIKLSEKNEEKLEEYYELNPLIKNKSELNIKKIKRISVAPANPYWSPIVPADIELTMMKDADKHKYPGCDGRSYIFYHRKKGCSYYDQYLAYLKADVIMFNSAKYNSELALGRKPETEIDIIDEADEYLDSLFAQAEINLTRLAASLKQIYPDYDKAEQALKRILELVELEERNKKAMGVDESKVFHVKDTKILEILQILAKNEELESEIVLDELNYTNRVLEAAKHFEAVFAELYLTYKRDEDGNLYCKLVSTNLSGAFHEILSKSKALVFMSGTLHSREVLKHIFGINDFEVIEAETINQGSLEIVRTGKEFDCKYDNFKQGHKTREDYLIALESCVSKAELPLLVHVNAFQDLPSEEEKDLYQINNLMSREKLKQIQKDDKTGRAVSLFKAKMSDVLFTTKCSRGVDFPGDICNSMIFTKYPNPNVSDTFWKILQKTHADYYWEFYRDKANREFLQRLFRALRSREDHVKVLSPDLRVLQAVRELQLNNISKSS